MNKRKKQVAEMKNKVDSATYYDPPVPKDETFHIDVKRKCQEINNSTIGGF